MGANNSTPQTVRMENSKHYLAVQVTPSVVSRLVGDEGQAHKKMECRKCKENLQETPQNWTEDQVAFERKYNELEEQQFVKSIEKVKTMIGKKLTWPEDINKGISNLRNDLIKCYRDHLRQSLSCSDIAKQYQDFIFREQYKIILKSCDDSGFASTPHINTEKSG